ncbi:hypothetical protein GGI43DRAFT_402680 [Trichoderma evansii]
MSAYVSFGVPIGLDSFVLFSFLSISLSSVLCSTPSAQDVASLPSRPRPYPHCNPNPNPNPIASLRPVSVGEGLGDFGGVL